MLIMTQTKSEVVNLDSMDVIYGEPETACFNAGWKILARGASGKSVTLGRYEDKKRLYEVLREIITEYRIPGKSAYEMPER